MFVFVIYWYVLTFLNVSIPEIKENIPLQLLLEPFYSEWAYLSLFIASSAISKKNPGKIKRHTFSSKT